MSRAAGSRLVGLVAVACALVAALPAAASAAPSWHELAQPPGGASIASGGGRTYVAYVSGGRVRVATLTDAGWQPVGGGLVAHDPRRRAHAPFITVASDGHPWVAWTETDSGPVPRVRDDYELLYVARLGEGTWHEIGGPEPINPICPGNFNNCSASAPRLAFAGGRAFVSYTRRSEDPFTVIERLRADSSTWDEVGEAGASGFDMATVGGRLHVIGSDRSSPYPRVDRLRADGSGFDEVTYTMTGDSDAQQIDIANLGASLGILHGFRSTPARRVGRLSASAGWTLLDGWIPFAGAHTLTGVDGVPHVAGRARGAVEVARHENGSWRHMPPTATDAPDSRRVQMVDANGAPWVLWRQRVNGRLRFRLKAWSDGAPRLPVAVRARTLDRNGCGVVHRGANGDDILVGTRARDAMLGLAGDDWLFGRRGRDCLRGGSGADRLYGGPGADFVYGGSGRDRLHGGKAHDVLYGGSGGDRIYPERGPDDVAAGAGRDTVYAVRGSEDHVDCGPGRDTLYASPNDGWRRCERVVIRR